MRPDDDELNFQDLHAIVFPAEVRSGENISAKFKPNGSDERYYTPVTVWRMSPLGLEFLHTSYAGILNKGERIDLELTIGGQRSIYEGLVVDVLDTNKPESRIGIRLNKREDKPTWDVDRRKGPRWICHDQFIPSCVCTNPAKYNDFLYFRVRDISHRGLRLVSSLRNKFLVPGMDLDLQISFPSVGNVAITVTISRVDLVTENGKDYFSLGVEFGDLPRTTRRVVGQYLLQFGNADSLKELRNNDFIPKSISTAVDYSFVKNVDEYIDICRLRFLSNKVAGKVDPNSDPLKMSDILDSRSRIIAGKYKGKLVTTSRLIFNEYDDLMEQEMYVKWPEDLPRRDQIVEVSRACTHPEFRGGDLLFSLFQFMVVISLQAKRDWIVISTAPDMVTFYEKIGFRKTGMQYENPIYPGITQVVMLANVPDAMRGRTVSPIYWNVIWKDVTEFLVENDVLSATSLTRIRLFVYRLMYPFAVLLRRRSKKPRPKPNRKIDK